jgi:glycosyltransferase involved in cell wall biosynthesis
MNGTPPLISIVTPSLNRREFIGEAIQSVLDQDYAHVEHVVVDGGSTDGTLDLLRRYAHLRVISEPDRGLYEALNKGVRAARGAIIGHLNSDDFYEPNIFADVAHRFRHDPEIDLVSGEATVFEDKQGTGRARVAQYVGKAQEMSFETIILGVPIINARFLRKRVYEKIGLYDTRYVMAADRDFLMRVALAGMRSVSLNRTVLHYRQHPGSLTISGEEGRRIQMLAEAIKLSESFLAERAIPEEARRCCRVSHSQASLEMVVQAVAHRRLGEALGYLLRGWRYDACWPRLVAARAAPDFVRVPFRWWRTWARVRR